MFISSSKRGKLTRKRVTTQSRVTSLCPCAVRIFAVPPPPATLYAVATLLPPSSRFQRFVPFSGIIYLLLTPALNINHRIHLTPLFHHVRLFPHMKQSPLFNTLFICIFPNLGPNLTTLTSPAMAPHQVPLVGQVRVQTPKLQLSNNKLMTPLVS